jgi:hypothetical protein
VPITLAHPVAVLPLRRLGLPMTALVIGTMVPDIPLFLGWRWGYALSHSVLGVLTADVALGVVVGVIWVYLVRDALVDLSPSPVRHRLAPSTRLDARSWLLALPALMIGSLTHVVWDSFTHTGRWGARQLGWLSTEHAGLAGASWLQYVSGVLGLMVVAGAMLRHVRRQPYVDTDPRQRVLPVWTLPCVVAMAALVGGVSVLRQLPQGLHAMAYFGVVYAILALVAGVAVVTASWQLRALGRNQTVG